MSVGSLLSWMVCGLIVGLIARFLLPGRQSMGLLMTMVLGIIGAVVGGFLYALIQGAPSESFSLSGNAWHGWIVAILGAVLVLWAYTALSGSPAPKNPSTFFGKVGSFVPGPAGLRPQGAAVQAQPPGPPGMPQGGPAAALAGQQNPNQARNLHTPSFDPGMVSGIMNAAQKVAEHSFRSGVAGVRNGAGVNWLENALEAALGAEKGAEVSTGLGNAGGEPAQTPFSAPESMPNRQGRVPGRYGQAGGFGQAPPVATGLGLGFGGVPRGNPPAAQIRSAWAGLAPGSPAPQKPTPAMDAG